MDWLPTPRNAQVSSERLPFAGCHAIKTPAGWEPAVAPLRALRAELAERVMHDQLIRPLVRLNFGDAPAPRFVWEED